MNVEKPNISCVWALSWEGYDVRGGEFDLFTTSEKALAFLPGEEWREVAPGRWEGEYHGTPGTPCVYQVPIDARTVQIGYEDE